MGKLKEFKSSKDWHWNQKKKSKSTKTTTLTKKVAKLQKTVNANTQRCWVDEYTNLSSITSTGQFNFSFLDLENIPATTPLGPTTRIGNKITINKINLTFNQVASTSDDYNFCRYIVFILPETPAPISSLNVDDIIQGTALGVDEFYKKDGKVKFTILYDKVVMTSLINDSNVAKKWKVRLHKCKRWPKNGLSVHYKDANIGNPIKNIIGILAISDSSALAHPTATILARTHYLP